MNYSSKDLEKSIKKLGLTKGDLVYVPSAFFSLGLLSDCNLKKIPAKIFSIIESIVTKTGTICVPAAYEDYARLGKPYDCAKSPVDKSQGLFSEYVAKLPKSYRTYSPMNGVAGVGPLSKEICHTYVANSSGEGSAWQKLHKYNSKFLFIGIRPNQALNFIFYIQQRFGVPHLYNKIYDTPIFEKNKKINLKVTAFVRYLNPQFKIIEDALKFEKSLFADGIIKTVRVGKGKIYMIDSAKELYDRAIEKLQKNIYYFLKNKPNFKKGIIPMDGKTGKIKTDKQRYGQ